MIVAEEKLELLNNATKVLSSCHQGVSAIPACAIKPCAIEASAIKLSAVNVSAVKADAGSLKVAGSSGGGRKLWRRLEAVEGSRDG